jgi:hypothetical protein
MVDLPLIKVTNFTPPTKDDLNLKAAGIYIYSVGRCTLDIPVIHKG